MKKYLLTSAAALAFCGLFTSCTHDLGYDESSAQDSVVKTYEQAFITAFGQPDPNQEWGFGTSTAKAATRTITVNGDAYDKFPSAADISANFPTAVPEGADEVSELESKYQGTVVKDQWGNDQTLHNLYHIYAYKIVEGYNLKITKTGATELGGSYQNSAWDQTAGKEIAHPYNVYVDVDGDVTIRRNGATHFNLYILRGNVTIESNYGEQAGIISVASGATLNDQRNSIAANQGIKLFNRGTVNATNSEKYDIGNFSTVYNEGKFKVTGALTYSPGDTNDSYFMNLGDDAELTAPSMTLNSAGNFFNSGKVNITGETFVTQARLYWVNAGFYRTGSMTFSAKNTTFYNYCQLIVRGNAHMYDGEFNLMEDSYTEAGTAEMDNFIVNMGSNTGMHIKGNVKLEAQGDATYQGFKTSGSNDYLLIDGKVTVASHKKTFCISSGITYSINALEIIKGDNVVTEEYLQSIGDGDYPVLDFNGTECPYGELTVTPNENSCGANWNGKKPNKLRIICEDLSVKESSDWDFNDVVFDIELTDNNSQAKITLKAAGGTLPLYIGDEDHEVHDLFAAENPSKGITRSTMINTKASGGADGCKEPTFKLDILPDWTEGADYNAEDGLLKAVARNLPIKVFKLVSGTKTWVKMEAMTGKPAAKIAVSTGFNWCDERIDITKKYKADVIGTSDEKFSTFKLYVKSLLPDDWYNVKEVSQDLVREYSRR